jgi:hypothetical protein
MLRVVADWIINVKWNLENIKWHYEFDIYVTHNSPKYAFSYLLSERWKP